jgi:hypothetical protein
MQATVATMYFDKIFVKMSANISMEATVAAVLTALA